MRPNTCWCRQDGLLYKSRTVAGYGHCGVMQLPRLMKFADVRPSSARAMDNLAGRSENRRHRFMTGPGVSAGAKSFIRE